MRAILSILFSLVCLTLGVFVIPVGLHLYEGGQWWATPLLVLALLLCPIFLLFSIFLFLSAGE